MMKKRVLLLAVSCKNGGLCPGGIDLDNRSNWIRIVRDDGRSGAVQGIDIDFAQPLDIIEFVGRPMPQGKQLENWVIDYNSCKKVGSISPYELISYCEGYGYHFFWRNYKAYLNEDEFMQLCDPTESILLVKDVRIYKSDYNKAKIDFFWIGGSRYIIKGISLTDPDFYDRLDNEQEILVDKAYIVISIPKDLDWIMPSTGEKRAYKFVSKVFELKT